MLQQLKLTNPQRDLALKALTIKNFHTFNPRKPLPKYTYDEPDWFGQVLTVNDTNIPGLENIIEEELASGMPRPIADQEYLCSFEAALVGAIYGEQIKAADEDNRITSVPYDPNYPVETWWDLGVRDGTAIWFVQRAGREIRAIDFYEQSGVGIDHYADVLAKRGYVYNRHVAPHDINVQDFSTPEAKTRWEVAANFGSREVL